MNFNQRKGFLSEVLLLYATFLLFAELLASRGSARCPQNAPRQERVGPRYAALPAVAQLMPFRLFNGSFRPARAQCALTSMRRQREMFLFFRHRYVLHMPKVLARMNIHFARVMSDGDGTSAQ